MLVLNKGDLFMIDLSKLNQESFNPEILYVYYHQKEKSTTPNHAHDFLEISIIMSGEAVYFVEGESYPVQQGDVLLFNPGVNHYEIINESSICAQLHIGFRNFLMEGFAHDYFPISKPCIKLKNYQDELFELSKKIKDEEKQKLPGYEIVLKSLLSQLIITLMRDLTSATHVASTRHLSFESFVDRKQIVNTIITYLSENYMNEISLEKLSENMYLSSIYISKIFKEETGDSPINYLIKLRLSHGYRLLESKKYSVKSVSKKIGYKDAYYFSKVFKKHYGYPPSFLLKRNDNKCNTKDG